MRTVGLYLILIVFASTLTGCFGATIPGKPPAPFDDHDQLAQLIGQKEEKVIEELGRPNQVLSDGTSKFLMYWTKSSGADVLFMLWVPVAVAGDKDSTLHCVRFELDIDNRVKVYGIESGGWQKLFDTHELSSRCQSFFWSDKDLRNLRVVTGSVQPREEILRQPKLDKNAESLKTEEEKVFQRAVQGNPEAQLALFYNLRGEKPNEALTWLCKSADSGNQEARFILGNMFEYGGYIWVKEGIVKHDYKLAYVWYGLSAKYDQDDLQIFANRHLTAKEQLDAGMALDEWQPGQCTRELNLTESLQ